MNANLGRLLWVNQEIKKLEAEKEQIREEFFKEATTHPDRRPLQQIPAKIPGKILQVMDISLEELIRTRFPGWRLAASENLGEVYSVILEEDPDYIPLVIPYSGFDIQKQIRFATPELDYDMLKAIYPDVYERIVVEKEVVTIDRTVPDSKLESWLSESPENMNLIKLFTRAKAPTKALIVKEAKNEK